MQSVYHRNIKTPRAARMSVILTVDLRILFDFDHQPRTSNLLRSYCIIFVQTSNQQQLSGHGYSLLKFLVK